jgi:predicted Zn-dependent protease
VLGTIGQIGGAILGGSAGQAIGVASQVGAAAWSTKYTREYEAQADLLGAQMLARAGYDPRRWPTCSRPSRPKAVPAGPSG